jgi:hypothetical protein
MQDTSQTVEAYIKTITDRLDVDETRALLGYYAALNGTHVPTFRDNPSVPKVKKSKKKAFLLGCGAVMNTVIQLPVP